ncbi:DUF3140 domain-containing protein [Streptomyces sp. NPDC002690]
MSGGEDHARSTAADDFGTAVNMTATELERWLGTDASREVGQKDGTGESTGHASGRRIVELPRTGKGDLGDYQDLDVTPDSVASTTRTLAVNTTHLARLLAEHPYPAST